MGDSEGYQNWSKCLDSLLEFDRFDQFVAHFTQPTEFIFYMNGLIRATIQYSKAGKILIREGNLPAAEVIARSAFEHALWAQYFYLHKEEPDLLKKKALTDVESLLRRCKEDSEFFKYGLNELSQSEEEFEKSYEELIVELDTLKTTQKLPTDSGLSKLLTPNLSKDSAQLVRLYMGMSHFAHGSWQFKKIYWNKIHGL